MTKKKKRLLVVVVLAVVLVALLARPVVNLVIEWLDPGQSDLSYNSCVIIANAHLMFFDS